MKRGKKAHTQRCPGCSRYGRLTGRGLGHDVKRHDPGRVLNASGHPQHQSAFETAIGRGWAGVLRFETA